MKGEKASNNQDFWPRAMKEKRERERDGGERGVDRDNVLRERKK